MTKLLSEVVALAAWHDLIVKTLEGFKLTQVTMECVPPRRRCAALASACSLCSFGPLRRSWVTVTSQSADGWDGGEVVLALLLGDREGLLYDFVCVPGSLLFPDGGSDNWLLLLRALGHLLRNLDLRRPEGP